MNTWLTTRTAGILAHVSSLPGDYGIGNLGPSARQFLDFLAEAGVRNWQLCPIGPTGFGDSPYQSFSTHAGNPYFIDLGELLAAELLTPADVAPLRSLPAHTVDYGRLYELFWPILARAADRFIDSGLDRVAPHGPISGFRSENSSWLQPYTYFTALKAHHGGGPWYDWPAKFRHGLPTDLSALPAEIHREACRQIFYQYLFFGQWARLRAYAQKHGIAIIGDVPIFVAMDSVDTWQNRAVFRVSAEGRPTAVAGVPPDYFSAFGQLWGNPLYDWQHLARTQFAWWIDRLRAAFSLYDIIRLDHFRGFDTYWEIPYNSPDARTGSWQKGPGLAFFQAVQAALPQARIIAEDLGYIGPDIVALRRAAGLPGMKILQFAYGHDANNVNLPHRYPPDSIAYTGTHDNLTTRGWLEGLDAETAPSVRDYYQLDGSASAWPIIRSALATVSRLAVIPIQDLLDLDELATLNRPGTAVGNWQWRFTAPQLSLLADEKLPTLRHWINLYDRDNTSPLIDYSEAPADHV